MTMKTDYDIVFELMYILLKDCVPSTNAQSVIPLYQSLPNVISILVVEVHSRI